MKKFLKYTLITFLVLTTLAFAAPFMFKGKIMNLIKTKANEKMNAKLNFKDVDISLFRHFPKLTVGIDSISIVGVNEFDNDTLLAAQKVDVSMNLWSAISGKEINIYGVDINEAFINTIVNKQGKANWDIAKKDSNISAPSDTSAAMKLKLNHYSLNKCRVKYSDYAGDMFIDIDEITHSGSGDFEADIFTLKTKTNIEKWNFKMNGISYINNAKTNADIELQVDAKAMKFTFNTDKINVNDLQIATDGFFQMLQDGYAMDINYKSPNTEFKNILSLVPSIYQNNFNTIKTSGKANFNGFVKGTFNASSIPAYQVNVQVTDGFFQYPDLPAPVKDINIAMKVDNPDGVTDHTVVDISKGHISFADEPFDFKLLVKNPISDLFVDASANGKLDLSKVSQFIKMPDISKLQGIVIANAAFVGTTKAAQNKQLNQVKASGTIDLSNFSFASKDYPSGVDINSLNMSFNPNNVTLSNLAGRFMNTKFQANGFVNNLLPYVLQNDPLNGVMNIKADNLDLNTLMGLSADTSQKTTSAPNNIFLIPKNLDLTLNASVDNIHYDKLDMNNLAGSLKISNETVSMQNVKAKALNGDLGISGFYSTKLDNKKPDISFTYNVNNVDIQKTFYTFNTMQKLMPIGQFLSGRLTSGLNITGKLGDNLMPDLNSLTGNGNFLMLEGLLNKFTPLDKIATTLNIKPLQNVSMKDVKAFFEFTNGKVYVKPFKIKVSDIEMEIAGTHGFTQDMDYTINMKLPRAMMGSNGNNFINNLQAKAQSKGLPIKVSEIINLQIKMGGTISNPTIKTDLKQSATSLADEVKNQVSTFVQNKIDSTKNAVTKAVEDKKNEIKDTVKNIKNDAIKAVKDEAINKIFGKKDSTNKTDDLKNRVDKAKDGILKNLPKF